jgi:dTDP-4-amino-4,6-dideoxygalactose transaminase
MTGKLDQRVLDEPEAMAFPQWPVYGQDELDVVARLLKSGRVNYWTGHASRDFETEFAEYVGVNHAVAVSNGSLALGIALRALDLAAGAEVIVTPRTFVASVSEILLARAIPVFADVDPNSQNVTPESIERLISKRTGAIIAVHLAGWPCEMEKIRSLSNNHRLAVIEDCAQSHGAEINGRKTGGWGDIAAFSFCQDKIISTGGEGGMIVTDDDEYWQRCWSFKDHGKSMSAVKKAEGAKVFQWLHESVGTNARLTELQAAIGRCQLGKLDRWIELRNRNARVLTNRFQAVNGLRVTVPPNDIRHAYYKYYVFVRPDALKKSWSRDRIVAELVSLGIPCGSGICPEVYLEKAFSGLDSLPKERLPVARMLGDTSLMFPVHPTLTERNMVRIADALESVMARATA